MDVMEIYRREYERYKIDTEPSATKLEWVGKAVFDMVTYDTTLDVMMVKKIFEVCKVISERRSWQYVKNDNNAILYAVVCQLLNHKWWIEWCYTTDGARFDDDITAPDPIIDIEYYGEDAEGGVYENVRVPFSEKNLMKLIQFVEEE